MVATRVPGDVLTTPVVHEPREGPAIGVLALQGDVLEHLRMLRAAGASPVVVNRADHLDLISGIVIPGGESTTIGKLADMYGLLGPLRNRITEGLPAFGTCAGAILLSSRALFHDGRPAEQPLIGALPMAARRNAFGRQVASFETDLDVEGLDAPLHAVFIRAPWFEDIGAEVEVLATASADGVRRPVVVRQGRVLAAAFHPELAGDSRLHRLFLDIVTGHVPGERADDPVVPSAGGS